MRRGEIRALRWQNVDFKNNTIAVIENFVEYDGFKNPKQDSVGTIPMADDLANVLQELKRIASAQGFDNGDDFVIFNTSHGVPVAESTIKRGYRRTLALIGIEDDAKAKEEKRPPHPGSQQARHLVLHSGRRGAATRLAEDIGARNAVKITRHKSPQAFMGYAAHDTAETLEKARKTLNIVDTKSEKSK
ncbi:MAG: tyrosine-type recombinase/integrase [Treponema sp.]|nr:tyrosine-type recombinase/integrase [Treponema sp.]